MFYRSDEPNGLPFDPFKAIVAPRPIGWIGTLNADGVPNLAPYSFFTALASRPNMIGFCSESLKHSARNARDTGEFTFNLATLPLAEAMNASSAELPDGANEFQVAGLTAAPSQLISAPYVKESPAALECRTVQSLELRDIDGNALGRFFTIGQVVAVHIDDTFIVDGRFDTVKAQTISRGGYRDFATVENVWEMLRPGD